MVPPVLVCVVAIPDGDAAIAVHFDAVLVVLPHFHYHAGFVPLGGVAACLVLHKDVVALVEWGEATRVFLPVFVGQRVSFV